MLNLNLRVVIQTVDLLGDSHSVVQSLSGHASIFIAPKGRVRRLFQAFHMICESKRGTLLIVPVASKLSFPILLVGRLQRLRLIAIEWGDIGEEPSFITKFGMRLCHGISHATWFKEPFMRELLHDLGAKNLFFLPNAVPLSKTDPSATRSIDMLWANRLVSNRSPEEFLKAVKSIQSYENFRVVVAGVLSINMCTDITWSRQQKILRTFSDVAEFIPFQPIENLLRDSKFFVLTGQYVFGNNSVLEAMMAGCVPIVTSSPGLSSLIVDGENGLVSRNDALSIEANLKRALNMTPEEWLCLSNAARRKVTESFSVTQWELSFSKLISLVDGT